MGRLCLFVLSNTILGFVGHANICSSNSLLYLVTDKTLYTPGEVIWFSGYLLNNGKQTDSLQPDIVSMALVVQGDTVAFLRKNYFMEGGLCAGNLTLPDSLPAGSYELVACCNVLDSSGMPVYVFRKPLTIKTLEPPVFNLTASFDDNSSEDSLRISLKLNVADPSIPKNKRNSLSYSLRGQVPHSVKLGAVDSLSVTLPWKDVAASNHFLYTSVAYNEATKPFVFPLPHGPEEKVRVKLFAEYGKLVSGKKQRVSWHCSYMDNTPAARKALLMNNNRVLDTLRTDSSGMGRFYLTPDTHASYSVRIIQKQQNTLSDFPLPQVESNDPILTSDNTLFNDTLNMTARIDGPSTFRFALRDGDSSVPLTAFMKADSVKNLRFVLDGLSKGVHGLELQDSAGNTLMEKPFFAHYGSDGNVVLATDKTEYVPREKVSVDINMEGDSAMQGVYTLYCVQTSRLEPEKQVSMEAYYYSYPFAQGNVSLNSYRNRAWLEDRMPSIHNQNAAQATRSNSSWFKPVIEGKVLLSYLEQAKGNAPDSLQVMIRRGRDWKFLPVSKGIFSPEAKDLIMPEDSILFAMAAPISNRSDMRYYGVQVEDPMATPMGKVVHQMPPYNIFALTTQGNGSDVLLNSFLGRELPTVTVQSKRSDIAADVHYTNPCGDYVCKYNYLDCIIHPPGTFGNHLPITGHVYRILYKSSFKEIVYQGCTTNGIVRIFTARRFIGMDSLRLASDNNIMLSTLYWQPFVFAQGNKKQHFNFYTSDLQGSFKIIAEGIDDKGEIFYKEVPFKVKNNKE